MSFDISITDIISDKDIKKYQEQGFWISPKILNDNQITKIPPEIGQLTNLKQLDLTKNRIQEIPAEISA